MTEIGFSGAVQIGTPVIDSLAKAGFANHDTATAGIHCVVVELHITEICNGAVIELAAPVIQVFPKYPMTTRSDVVLVEQKVAEMGRGDVHN